METFSALLAICAENSPVPGEFSAQRPVTQSFDIFFDLRLHNGLSKQSWGWRFETLSRPLWRHRNSVIGHREAIQCTFQRWHSQTFRFKWYVKLVVTWNTGSTNEVVEQEMH